MDVLVFIFQFLLIIFVPFLLIKFRNFFLFKKFGSIGGAYLIGLLLSLLIFLLNQATPIKLNKDLSEILSYLAIGISIPLLLFNANLKNTLSLSKKVILSYSLLIISVITCSIISFVIFNQNLEYSAIFSGMAVGLYTGGTPNLNAIGSVFALPIEQISLANVSDMIFGGLFYLFLLTICKPILKRFLKERNTINNEIDSNNVDEVIYTSRFKDIIFSFVISLGFVILGALVGFVIWKIDGSKEGKMLDFLVPSLLITVTVAGLLMSFFKLKSQKINTTPTGHYFMLQFSFALALSFDYNLLNVKAIYIFGFFAFVTFASFLVHTVLCKIFKIDVDIMMITLTAGIYGPAFVPAIAKQINREELTASGLICGSLGYGIGTILGIIVVLFLNLF